MVESSALLKRRSPKGYRGFESLPHRFSEKSGERELHNRCEHSPSGGMRTRKGGFDRLRGSALAEAGQSEATFVERREAQDNPSLTVSKFHKTTGVPASGRLSSRTSFASDVVQRQRRSDFSSPEQNLPARSRAFSKVSPDRLTRRQKGCAANPSCRKKVDSGRDDFGRLGGIHAEPKFV